MFCLFKSIMRTLHLLIMSLLPVQFACTGSRLHRTTKSSVPTMDLQLNECYCVENGQVSIHTCIFSVLPIWPIVGD